MQSIDYKAKGEKLLRIDVEIENNKISTIIITGDFFAHPEDIILKIEKGLKGIKVNEQSIIKRVKDIIKENDAKLIGLSPESIAEAIMKTKKI